MANWAFEIDIADSYIVGLTETLTDKGFRIWCFHNDDQPLYLFSSAYLSAASEDEVYGLARQLVRFIDGVAYLLFENKDSVNRIVLTRVFDVDTFRITNVQRDGGNVDVDFSVYNAGIEDEEHPVVHLLKLVPRDEFIKELLLALSQGMDFRGLYGVCDQIKMFLAAKGDSLVLLGFLQSTLDSFTHTAINFNTPEDPMFLKEAQELVSEMVFIVLQKYYRVNLKGHVIKDGDAGGDWYDSLYD